MNGAGEHDLGPCRHCGLSYEDPELRISGSGPGPDPCLGLLADVAQACCGHGGRLTASVCFGPGARPGDSCARLQSLTGADALAFFACRGVGPDIIDALSVQVLPLAAVANSGHRPVRRGDVRGRTRAWLLG